MKDKRKWQESSSSNPSFDDPKDCNEKCKVIAQNGILSILGKNIGLLSRKHKKERHKKYEKPTSAPVTKSPSKIKISRILKFQKPNENKINTTTNSSSVVSKLKSPSSDENGSQKKTKEIKSSKLTAKQSVETSEKSIISNNSHKKDSLVRGPQTKASDNKCQGGNKIIKPKSFKQKKPAVNKSSSKPAVERKVNQSKLRKSNSDTALNITKPRPPRAASAQSTSSRTSRASRAASSTLSRSSSRTTMASSCSKASTPQVAKKSARQKTAAKRRTKTAPESPDSGIGSETSPVVFVNYRYQVRGYNRFVQ